MPISASQLPPPQPINQGSQAQPQGPPVKSQTTIVQGPNATAVKRDMSVEVTEADKGSVQQLTSAALQILHSPEITGKLEQLIQNGSEVVVAVCEILEDIFKILDDKSDNSIPFRQLVLLGVVLLGELNKMVSTITGKTMSKSNLKLALKCGLQSIIPKENIQAAQENPPGPEGGPGIGPNNAPGPGMQTAMQGQAPPMQGGALQGMMG